MLHGVAVRSSLVYTRAHIRQDELESRQNVSLEKYIGLVTIEANCMIEMINTHVIPSTVACAEVIAVHGPDALLPPNAVQVRMMYACYVCIL